jgi:hypothetical protein
MLLSSAWGSIAGAERHGRMFVLRFGHFADAVIKLINVSRMVGVTEEDRQTDLGLDTTINEWVDDQLAESESYNG